MVGAFDGIDRHRLVAQVDSRLTARLDQVAHAAAAETSLNIYHNGQDADDVPDFLWQVGATGVPVSLTSGAPTLTRSNVPPTNSPFTLQLGTRIFRLQSRRIGDHRVLAGQSLAEVVHVENDLVALEVVAGPVLPSRYSSEPCSLG